MKDLRSLLHGKLIQHMQIRLSVNLNLQILNKIEI